MNDQLDIVRLVGNVGENKNRGLMMDGIAFSTATDGTHEPWFLYLQIRIAPAALWAFYCAHEAV